MLTWRTLIILGGGAIILIMDAPFIVDTLTLAVVSASVVWAIFHHYWRRGFNVEVKQGPANGYIHVIVDTQSRDEYEIAVTHVSGIEEDKRKESEIPWYVPWRNSGSRTISILRGVPERANLLRIDEGEFRAFSTTLPSDGWALKPHNILPPEVAIEIKVSGKSARQIQDWRVTVTYGDPLEIHTELMKKHYILF